MTTHPSTCTICQSQDDHCRHLALYVSGSEGVVACQACCIALSDLARHLMVTASKGRLEGFKRANRGRQTAVFTNLEEP